MSKYLLLVFFIITCSYVFSVENEKMVCFNRLHRHLSQKITSEHQLVLSVTGGSVQELIRKLDFGFNCYKKMEIPELRRLLVSIMDDCICITNRSEKIRKYLMDYPVNECNFQISIGSQDSKNNKVFFPHVSYVSIINGRIRYAFFSENKDGFDESLDYRETYQEALKIVQGESNSG